MYPLTEESRRPRDHGEDLKWRLETFTRITHILHHITLYFCEKENKHCLNKKNTIKVYYFFVLNKLDVKW